MLFFGGRYVRCYRQRDHGHRRLVRRSFVQKGYPRKSQQCRNDRSELFRGFGGLVGFVCGGVVCALQSLEKGIVFVIDLLHSGGISTPVRVMLHTKTAVRLFEFVQSIDVLKPFHFYFLLSVCGGGVARFCLYCSV